MFPRFFLGCLMGFAFEHAVSGAAASFAFLSTNLFDARAFSRDKPFLPCFDFVEEQPPREESV